MSEFIAGEVKEVELLSLESTYQFESMSSITTGTVYRGSPPLQSLRARLNAITELNPWLAGRLVKRGSIISLQYPAGAAAEADFLVLNDLNFTAPSYDPAVHNADFEQYFVERGTACVNKDKPIFRVVVAVLNPAEFVMFVSMSHTMADGSTYYSIYNMLSSDATPHAMIVERDEPRSLVIRSVNCEEMACRTTFGFMINMITRLLFDGYFKMSYYRVRPEWIEEQKNQFNLRKKGSQLHTKKDDSSCFEEDDHCGVDSVLEQPIPFVSSNDILTSAILRAIDADMGAMAVNFRNRVDGLYADHGGNYEAVVGFCKGDYEYPEYIRSSLLKRDSGPDMLPIPESVLSATPSKSLSLEELEMLGKETTTLLCGQYKRLRAEEPILPYFTQKCSAVVCIVSNWATFYEQINMDGREHVNHFPAYASKKAATVPFAVIYKSSANSLCLFAAEGRHNFSHALSQSGAVF